MYATTYMLVSATRDERGVGPTLGAEDDGHVGLALGEDGGVDLEDALQVLGDTEEAAAEDWISSRSGAHLRSDGLVT